MLAVLLCLAVPSAAAAKPFKVGTGQNGGIAIDDAGTVYVGWQINIYEPGDAVQFCVLPPQPTRCALAAHDPVPRPGLQPLARLACCCPAPNVVDVIVPRTNGRGAYSYLARSVDGGRTFGPAVQISGDAVRRGGPGPRRPRRARRRPDHHARRPVRARRLERRHRGQRTSARTSRACSPTSPPPARRCSRPAPTPARPHAFRLPAGRQPQQRRRVAADRSRVAAASPQLAGLPGGFAVDARADRHAARQPVRAAPRGRGLVAARRRSSPAVSNNDFAAHEQRQGPPDRAHHLLRLPPRLHDLDRRRRAVVLARRRSANFARVPGRARGRDQRAGRRRRGGRRRRSATRPSASRASRRAGARSRAAASRGARVQVRSICDGDGKLSLVVEAARGNRRVAPGTVLRRARFGRTRGARRGFRDSLPRALRRCAAARAHPRARHPAPRQGAHAAAARPPLRRDALMFELNAAERPHARPRRADPGARRRCCSPRCRSADLLAAIVFVIASATDALDGWLARRRSMVTAFGKLMDPLADKLLITAALVSLVALYRLDAWVAMVIIAREFAVTGLRMLAIEQGQVISASVWGKLKTTTQVAMVLALIWVDRPAAWVDILVYVTVAITVLSGADYFYRLRNLLADEPRSGGGAVEPLAHRDVMR